MALDQGFLSLKLLFRRALTWNSRTLSLAELSPRHLADFFRSALTIRPLSFIKSQVASAADLVKHLYNFSYGVMRSKVDRRTIKHLITKSGYEFAEFEVPTSDGYILQLHRVCNPSSFHVVYLQHGILDNAVTWVLHGPSDAIAYQAYEHGSLSSREKLHAYLRDISAKHRKVSPCLP